MANALAPETAPGVVVRSGIWVITMWSVQVAAPSTYTGGLRSDPRPLGARHDERPGAVGHEAAVEQVQRADLERRRQHVLDGDGLAVAGPRVQGRPLPGAHGDLGQLLGGRAELVHVARRGQRVGAHGRAAARRACPTRPSGSGPGRPPAAAGRLRVRSLRGVAA